MNNKEKRNLSELACHSYSSKGRQYKDTELLFNRTEYQRDRDRILYSDAFKRLKEKTQVFSNTQNDHVRTRLTHTLEVAQLSRSIARYLSLNDDLSEAIALAHDLGHPPFGHAGEEILSKIMHNYGGFNHNTHSLKIVTKIEKKYFNFDGLNLTYETLEGIVKHNGPLHNKIILPNIIKELDSEINLELKKQPSLEAQIANISDDIAYVSHDLEDGLRRKIINFKMIKNLPILGNLYSKFIKEYSSDNPSLLTHYLTNKLSNHFINQLVTNSINLINEHKINNFNDLKEFDKLIIKMNSNSYQDLLLIKKFLFKNMYQNEIILHQNASLDVKMVKMFEFYANNPENLPKKWQTENYLSLSKVKDYKIAEDVCDYIANMTDSYFVLKCEEIKIL